jgi:signal peptidase I
LLVAHPDQQPAADAGADLRARIQARVEQRRQIGQSARGRQPMSAQPDSVDRRAADSGAGPRTAVRSAAPVAATEPRATRPGRHSLDGRRAMENRAVVAAPSETGPRGRAGLIGQPALVPDRAADRATAPRRRRHAASPAAPSLLRRAARWAVLLAFTAAVVVGLRAYVIASYYIPSASMETTLHGCPGCQPDLVLVDKLSYRFTSIDRRDVVVFTRPPQAPPEDKQLIKRVIGLPGEVVSGHDGHVFVNNKELIEPYVDPACHGTADFAPVRVPAGRYFVMGDNRCDSFDSRMFGTIPRSSVIGRAFAVIWPVHHLRRL